MGFFRNYRSRKAPIRFLPPGRGKVRMGVERTIASPLLGVVPRTSRVPPHTSSLCYLKTLLFVNPTVLFSIKDSNIPYRKKLVILGARRGVDLDFITLSLADQRPSDGRADGHEPVFNVSLVLSDELIAHLLVRVQIQ